MAVAQSDRQSPRSPRLREGPREAALHIAESNLLASQARLDTGPLRRWQEVQAVTPRGLGGQIQMLGKCYHQGPK